MLLVALVALCDSRSISAASAPRLPTTTVGMPVRVEQLVLPGAELEAAALTGSAPVVIRIDAVYSHGTAFRYDFVYQAMEPGDFDLRKFLKRKNGSTLEDLPPLNVKVQSLLPPGQVAPHALLSAPLPWLGGYRVILGLAIALWVAGMVVLCYPRRRRDVADSQEMAPPPSIAQRLRPLVIEAMAGPLPSAKLAELERLLVGYWRGRLALDDMPPAEVLALLREHPEASPLILQLERWLHRPCGDSDVDVSTLLAPYRDLPEDDAPRTPVLAGSDVR